MTTDLNIALAGLMVGVITLLLGVRKDTKNDKKERAEQEQRKEQKSQEQMELMKENNAKTNAKLDLILLENSNFRNETNAKYTSLEKIVFENRDNIKKLEHGLIKVETLMEANNNE